MLSLKSRQSQVSGLDRLFEKGVSGVERTPQKTLSVEQIKAAVVGSKAGVGIWLLSHAKEILIGAISFAVGVGGTLLATHALQDKVPSQLPAEQITLVAADSLSEDTLSDDTIVYTTGSYEQVVAQPENQTASTGTGPKVSSPKQETVKTTSPKATATSTTSEPVVIKKTIVRRDTVRMKESIIVKDTVYIIEN